MHLRARAAQLVLRRHSLRATNRMAGGNRGTQKEPCPATRTNIHHRYATLVLYGLTTGGHDAQHQAPRAEVGWDPGQVLLLSRPGDILLMHVITVLCNTTVSSR